MKHDVMAAAKITLLSCCNRAHTAEPHFMRIDWSPSGSCTLTEFALPHIRVVRHECGSVQDVVVGDALLHSCDE
jgi:hypothetical protein